MNSRCKVGQGMGGQSVFRETASLVRSHRFNGRRRSGQVRAWKQTHNLDRGLSGWLRGGVWVVSSIDQDAIKTRSSSERETRLPMHARRPQECTPPSIDLATNKTGSNGARDPHSIHRGLSPWLFIFYLFLPNRTQLQPTLLGVCPTYESFLWNPGFVTNIR